MPMTLNNHYLAIKMFKETFTIYTKVLRKYMQFYDTYNRAFEDLFFVLVALSNAKD